MTRPRFTISIALLVAMTSLLTFATAPGLDMRLIKVQQDNAAALRKYEWKSRVEVQTDGETKNVQVSLMRYDQSGELQKTPISSTPQPDLPTHGLRGLIAKKRKQAFMSQLESLASIARSYSELPAKAMPKFMATATVTHLTGTDQNLIHVSGHDILAHGDSISLWIDPVTQKQRRIVVDTFLNNDPVRIVSEFQDLPHGGPTFNLRSQLNYNGTSLVMITQNFDYTPAQRRSVETISLKEANTDWQAAILNLLRFTGSLLYVQVAPAAGDVMGPASEYWRFS